MFGIAAKGWDLTRKKIWKTKSFADLEQDLAKVTEDVCNDVFEGKIEFSLAGYIRNYRKLYRVRMFYN